MKYRVYYADYDDYDQDGCLDVNHLVTKKKSFIVCGSDIDEVKTEMYAEASRIGVRVLFSDKIED